MNIASKVRQLGRVISDTRWWPFYLQRQVMQPATRDRFGSLIASRLRPSARAKGLPRSESAVSRHVKEMQEAGISHFGQLLTTEQATELHNHFLTKKVHDPYRADGATFLPDSTARHPDSHIAHHDAVDIVNAPYLLAIANRPDVLEVVSRLLGCEPTLGYLATWWSYHTALGAQQAEHFHRDVDDWRFVKLFIYLTDVGAENGPHIYVSHSSSSPKFREIRRFHDQEVVQAFGADKVLELTGNAGQGFLEDTFGIHKGQPVASGRRLIFQAVYSMFPLPYGPKSPVANANDFTFADGSRPDPWINRLYLRNR